MYRNFLDQLRFSISLCCFPAVIIFSFISVFFQAVTAQTTQVQFGQNRVQYHPFDWQYYNSDNFTIYFYPGGQEIGKFIWTTAEMKVKELEDDLEFRFNDKIDILVYNDITDMAQTNIGLGQEEFNLGGTAVLKNNKLFLYYDGNHQHLERDLMKGMAEVMLRQMMTGSNFKQKIQNSVFLNLPEWYRKGLSAYIAENWNTVNDNRLKNYLANNKKTSFSKLAAQDPEFAGQSFWNMVREKYGSDAIQNILYLTRVKHNMNSGFAYAINTTYNDLIADWKTYYSNRFKEDEENRTALQNAITLKLKKRNNTDIGDMVISADGNYLAYAVFDGGFYKIFVQNTQTKKVKKIAKGGFHSDQYPFDKSYPILTWSKTGNKLVVIHEKKDKIRLLQFDVALKEKVKKNIIKFQRIYGADFTNNPNLLVLSGQNKGQTDLYLYNISNSNSTQLNNDLYDDLNPVYVHLNESDGILFSSNREDDKLYFEVNDTVLPDKSLDLFYYDLNKRGDELARVTETPFANEKGTGSYIENKFSFLSDENGISNLYTGTIDSFFIRVDTLDVWENESTDSAIAVKKAVDIYKLKGITSPLTNLPNSILASGNSNAKTFYFFGVKRKKTSVSFTSKADEEQLENAKKFGLTPTTFRRKYLTTATDVSSPAKTSILSNKQQEIKNTKAQNSGGITVDSLLSETFTYTFESDFNNTLKSNEQKNSDTGITTILSDTTVTFGNTEEEAPPPFIPPSMLNVERTTGKKIRILSYRARFSSDYVVTQIDNSILTTNYQSYNANLGGYSFPNLSGMIAFGTSDLMEDHKIIGGFRFPFDFKGLETFVKYINLKHRLDHSILYYRKSDRTYFNINNPYTPDATYTGKTRMNFLEYTMSYPFDITKSLKAAFSYRNERLDVSYSDPITLAVNDIKENWISSRVEFVHDNSKEIQTNIYNGYRYKVFGEYFYNANEKKSHLFNLGFDVRHYQKIFRNLIWANRLAGATSFGNKKILYYLGGVDSWLNPKYDYNIPVSSTQNYGLQAFATNLRGLPQNIRNGNNYLLLNSELRFPVISFFAKKPLKSSFLQDFQLVGFFDAGIAYTLLNPFDRNNSISQEVVSEDPLVISVNYYRNPFVFGCGGGMRTNILGYFLRVDAGWGYDGSKLAQKPIWHISLSKDF